MPRRHPTILETPRTILIFGAGKSATVLIRRLLSRAQALHWQVILVDQDLNLARQKCMDHAQARALSFDIADAGQRRPLIGEAQIVISMLPPSLHHLIAADCLELGKNLLTASYMDDNIKKHAAAIQQKGLLFLCEMGLDPGIDHMSALQLIHGIQRAGGHIRHFVSHCGGLVTPDCDDNAWHYKISWNPANIVQAGKAGAVFKRDGQLVEQTYPDLFRDCPTISLPDLGTYAYYANRNAAAYAALYGLEDAATFIRTTLRHPDFCKGWYYLIQAGLTTEQAFKDCSGKSIKNLFLDCLQQIARVDGFEAFLEQLVTTRDRDLVRRLFDELGLFTDNRPLFDPDAPATPARMLQSLLENKLGLKENDKDMILMLHEIGYELDGIIHIKKSYMKVGGTSQLETAMAKTVGLPLAIATELILEGQLQLKGLHIPIIPEIYEPVLKKLKENDIRFEAL